MERAYSLKHIYNDVRNKCGGYQNKTTRNFETGVYPKYGATGFS